LRLLLLTLFVLIAFAGNSVIARLALNSEGIGPWTFSVIRFASGAIILLLLARPKIGWQAGRWSAALALCAYGVFFSFAYLMLETGMGALILFAAVQLTMLAIAFHRGERLQHLQWFGLLMAIGGLAYLLSPGLNAPSPLGAAMMTVAGLGWGVYSVMGKGAGDPIARTAGHFARAGIMLILTTPILLLASPEPMPHLSGVSFALLSGIVTSGLGYALWYHVLRDISVTTASVSQLSVPVIAAIGGAVFVFEPVTLPFAVSCAVVLVGVGLATIKPNTSS